MPWRDMDDLGFSVTEHRQWLHAEISDSRIWQQWLLRQLGHICNRVGIRLIVWGDGLRATSSPVQLQQTSR